MVINTVLILLIYEAISNQICQESWVRQWRLCWTADLTGGGLCSVPQGQPGLQWWGRALVDHPHPLRVHTSLTIMSRLSPWYMERAASSDSHTLPAFVHTPLGVLKIPHKVVPKWFGPKWLPNWCRGTRCWLERVWCVELVRFTLFQ
jgi:hypothetical protein